MSHSFTSHQIVQSTPHQVYLAFTRSLYLRQWLCDFATCVPQPGGRLYLWWAEGYYSTGEYIELVEDKKIKYTWRSNEDPAFSEVLVSLESSGAETKVTLEHSVPDGEEWKERGLNFKTEWDVKLPNLASLLETGLDRRIFDRPMLGIQIGDFSAEIASASGVPVKEGLRLAQTIEGMGAHAAGLAQDDVIVEFNGHPITNDFNTLALALKGKKGGEKVQVTYYRGPKKHTVTMELTRRPEPQVPATPAELSSQARQKYDQALEMLATTFSGVSDSDASFSPAPGEWSANETLAHIIHTERNWMANIDEIIGTYERNGDNFGGNIPEHIHATVHSFGNTAGLLAELKFLADEVVAFLASLPPELVARKCDYLSIGNVSLEGMLPHTITHIEQIKRSIAAARA